MHILTKDQLSNLHTSELKSLFLDVRSRINKLRKKKGEAGSLKELETYYCYIFRELEKKQWYEGQRAS